MTLGYARAGVGKLWLASLILITVSGSFVDKHKLAHIKKDLRTQDYKIEDPVLRDHNAFKTKIDKSESNSRLKVFFRGNYVFETKSESIFNNISSSLQNKTKVCLYTNFAHTHTAKN